MFFMPLAFANNIKSSQTSLEIDTSLDCLVNYLREKDLDEEIFNKTARVATLSEACNRRIKSEKDAVFIESTLKYEDKKEFKQYHECFVDSIKNDEKFLLLQMKRKAIDSIKMSWKSKLNPKNWVSSDKKKALQAVDAEISKIDLPNLFNCEYSDKLSRVYNDLVDRKFTIGKPQNTIDNVCMRNFLHKAEKSKQITHEIAEDCDEVEQKLKLNVLHFLRILFINKKIKIQNCIDEKTLTDDVYSPFFYIESFYELVVKNRENEKKKFVDKLLKIYKQAYTKCI